MPNELRSTWTFFSIPTPLVPRPTVRQLGGTGKTLLALSAAGVGVTSLCIGYAGNQDWTRLARNWTSNTHLKFPASSNFTDLSQHNNTMAKVLPPKMYSHLRDQVTPNGCTLD